MAQRTAAYLGPEGTFSHLVARKKFRNAEGVPCPTIAAVIDHVLSNPGARAAVPIENSSGGAIYDTVDLLIQHASRLRIDEELALDVRLGLLGRDGKGIRRIYSHFAPLQHYRDWIRENYPDAEVCPVSSTAVAAELAAREKGAAALSSPGAAEIYGLRVLKFPILPQAINETHFFLISRAEDPGPVRRVIRNIKTALVFELQNRSGSLYAFLRPFARAHVNLTRIISRPVPGRPREPAFFAELEGGESAAMIADTLRKARRHCQNLISLGSYPTGSRMRS